MLWERVPYPEHPNRCQALRGEQGQCINMAVDGSQYCPAHGGNHGAAKLREAERKLYEVNKYLNAHNKRDNNALLTLTTEVAYLKAIIERKMALITDDHSLIMHSTAASNLLMQAEKLVTSCVRLQEKLGQMMTAEQALQFADDVQQAIRDEVTDVRIIEKIQQRIADLISAW